MHQSGLARRMLALAALCIAVLGIVAGIAQGSNRANSSKSNEHGGSYTIGLFGDMPYNALGKAQYPELLADINAQHVAFSVFDGDLKAGGDGPCSRQPLHDGARGLQHARAPARLAAGRQRLDRLLGPLRPGHTPYSDPLERLDHERQLFTSTIRASARRRSTLTRESSEGGRTRSTRRTSAGRSARSSTSASTCRARTTTTRTPGVDGETAPNARDRAPAGRGGGAQGGRPPLARRGLRLREADRRQGRDGRLAGRSELQQRAAPADTRSYDAFPDYVDALRADTLAFAGQVVLVHGDSHYFKVDKPINARERRRARELHPRRDVRRASTDWVRHGRPAQPEPVHVRADGDRGHGQVARERHDESPGRAGLSSRSPQGPMTSEVALTPTRPAQ